MKRPDNPPVVFKLGGSLLDWPELPQLLAQLPRLRPGTPLLVAGGGAAADLVRDWDRLYSLGQERSHWLALEALALNEQLLQTLWPALRLVRSGPQFARAVQEGVPALVCAACFTRWAEGAGRLPLPHDWIVTSDSVAAWIAQIVGADELVLLKSTDLSAGASLESAAADGLVDGYFPTAARGLAKITWINGRSHRPVEQSWFVRATG